eukprot:2454414-Amphidinium_carterae.2
MMIVAIVVQLQQEPSQHPVIVCYKVAIADVGFVVVAVQLVVLWLSSEPMLSSPTPTQCTH